MIMDKRIRLVRKKKSLKLTRISKGQSLVELALSASVLILLLAGAFDIGSAFFDYIALRDAAQEGTVYGSIDPSHQDRIIYRIRQSSTRPLDMTSFIGDCNPINGICIGYKDINGNSITDPAVVCSGDSITITVRYHYNMTMPFLSGTVVPLHSTVTNVVLAPMCP